MGWSGSGSRVGFGPGLGLGVDLARERPEAVDDGLLVLVPASELALAHRRLVGQLEPLERLVRARVRVRVGVRIRIRLRLRVRVSAVSRERSSRIGSNVSKESGGQSLGVLFQQLLWYFRSPRGCCDYRQDDQAHPRGDLRR